MVLISLSYLTAQTEASSIMLIRSGNGGQPWLYRAKGKLPLDGSLWHKEYFELKIIKTQYIQKKLFTPHSAASQ